MAEEEDSRLCEACRTGRVGLVRGLLASGVSPVTPSRGATPLVLACESDRAEIVNLLLEARARADQPAFNGITPLVAAASANNREMVIALCAAGAPPDGPADVTLTPMLACARQRDGEGVARALLQARADANYSSDKWGSPLHVAAAHNNVGAIRALCAAGGDLNARHNNKTPLEAAEARNRVDAMSTLRKEAALAKRRLARSGAASGSSASVAATEVGDAAGEVEPAGEATGEGSDVADGGARGKKRRGGKKKKRAGRSEEGESSGPGHVAEEGESLGLGHVAEEGESSSGGVVAYGGPSHDPDGPAEPDAEPAHSPTNSPSKSPSADLLAAGGADRVGGRDSKSVVDAALRRADGLLASRVIGEMAAEAARKQAQPLPTRILLPSVDPTRIPSIPILDCSLQAHAQAIGEVAAAVQHASERDALRSLASGAATEVRRPPSRIYRTHHHEVPCRRDDARWRARSRRRRRRALRRRNGGS